MAVFTTVPRRGGKAGMLSSKLHLMIRLPLVLVFSCTALVILPAPLRADGDDPSARTDKTERTERTDKADKTDGDPPGHSRSALNEIMQAGAKLAGKSAPTDNHHPIELDAKGTSESSARKAAIAALPVEQLTAENRQKVEKLIKSVSGAPAIVAANVP